MEVAPWGLHTFTSQIVVRLILQCLGLPDNISRGLDIGFSFRRIFLFCTDCKGKHILYTGRIGILNGLTERIGVDIKKFLVSNQFLVICHPGRQIIICSLSQGRQPFIYRRNPSGEELILESLLCRFLVRILGGIHRILLPEKFIQIKSKILRPLAPLLVRQLRFKVHNPVFLRDIVPVSVVELHETAAGVPDIAEVGIFAAVAEPNVPAVGFIINVVS